LVDNILLSELGCIFLRKRGELPNAEEKAFPSYLHCLELLDKLAFCLEDFAGDIVSVRLASV
jgi:hypothetical protein